MFNQKFSKKERDITRKKGGGVKVNDEIEDVAKERERKI